MSYASRVGVLFALVVCLAWAPAVDAQCLVFSRGDVDNDGDVDMDDAQEILDCLFNSTCGLQYGDNPDAYDADDDGTLNGITDSIFILNGGTPAPPTWPPCLDPTPDSINSCCDVKSSDGARSLSSRVVYRTAITGFGSWPTGTSSSPGSYGATMALTSTPGACDELNFGNKLRFRWNFDSAGEVRFTLDQLSEYVSRSLAWQFFFTPKLYIESKAWNICSCVDEYFDYADNRFNLYNGTSGKWELIVENKTASTSGPVVVMTSPVTASDPFCLYEHKFYVEDDECDCDVPTTPYFQCTSHWLVSCNSGACLGPAAHPTGCAAVAQANDARTMRAVSVDAAQMQSLLASKGWNGCDELAIIGIQLDGWTARLYHQVADGDLSENEEMKVTIQFDTPPTLAEPCK